jgi:ribosomal protein S18 acetylase RimI-like enzyme
VQQQIEGITIDAAHPGEMGEAADLRAVMATEMGNHWDDDHPGWRERFVHYFGEKQQAGQAQLFYAKSNQEIVGMVFVSLVDDYHAYVRDNKSGRVNSVYVIPAYRRRGIGQALMHAAMDWLRTKGCVVVRLHSSEDGVALYQSLGFKPRRELEYVF